MTGIYMIQNKVNNKMYIGQAFDIDVRWKAHKNALRNNYHGNNYLQNAWNKYSEDNFEFRVLQECDEEDLDTFETLYINILKTLAPDGYNLKEGGSNGRLSEETKQKMSEAKTGKQRSEETKEKISKSLKGQISWNKGKNHSETTKQKISEALKGEKNPFYGKNHTKETKEKISDTLKGKMAGEKHPRWIPITDEMIKDYKNGIRRKDFLIKYNVNRRIWDKVQKKKKENKQ